MDVSIFSRIGNVLPRKAFGNRVLSAFCIEIGFSPEDSGNLDYFLEMISFLSHVPDAKNTAEPKGYTYLDSVQNSIYLIKLD